MRTIFKKLIFTFPFLFLTSINIFAQSITVVGNVYCKETNLPMVNVNVCYKVDSQKKYTTTQADGSFKFAVPKNKHIQISFSCTGFQPQTKILNAHADNRGLKIYLSEKTIELTDVVVKAHAANLKQRNDTIVYIADNIKTNPDATGLDMIKKLPGITYKDNKLEAEGKIVSEIRVDGKEFYKSDVDMALKNLPKDIISEIKLFEELSDYAKLAGIDDGSGKMIIDITTKNGSDDSTFGKTSGAYGTDNRHTLYGVFNRFGKSNRLSVFAQKNNINEQNFSNINLLGVTGTVANNDPTQSPFSKNAISNSFSHSENNDVNTMMTSISPYGITETTAAGLNMSGDSKNGKFKYSGHYLFNVGDNNTVYNIYDEYFGETVYNNRQFQNLHNKNLNHRFNFKFEYHASPKDYLLIRPSFVMQKRDQNSSLTDWTVKKENPMNTGNMDYDFSDVTKDSLLLNQLTLIKQTALKTADEVMYMHKFNHRGHALSVDAKFSYTKTDEDMNMELKSIQSNEHVLQNTDSKNDQRTFTTTLSYILPFSKYGKIKVDAGWNKEYSHIKQATETNVNHAETFKIDSMLCGRANTNHGGLLANVSYLYDRKRWNIVTGSEYHHYKLWTENDREIIRHYYDPPLPFLFLRYKHGGVRWNLQYKTSQMFPTCHQLLEAINNTNSIMSIKGNNRLEASYHHNISSRLILTNSKTSSHFVFFSTFEKADNYIGARRSLSSTSWVNDARHRNSEMYSYVNVNGYWSAKGLLAYGFPVHPIKSNVNLSTMLDYCNVPGFWDKDKLVNKQWNWNGFLTIGSNISENIDFVFDTNVKYNQCTNMAYKQMNISYWSLSYGAQLKWLISKYLPVTLECGRTNYFGSGTSQFNALIANMSVGYKFLKNKNAEFELTCHDIFNQDNSFLQTTTELYRRQMTTSLLKRYFMLRFTYTHNSLKKSK